MSEGGFADYGQFFINLFHVKVVKRNKILYDDVGAAGLRGSFGADPQIRKNYEGDNNMKRFFTVFLTVAMLAALMLPVANARSLADGAVIVIPEKAEKTEVYAAETLQKSLKEVTGREIRIIRDNEKANAYKILVGKTALTMSKTEGLADGSYVIKSGENRIEIVGTGNRGTIYGVFRFLEEFAGFRCYSDKIGYKSYTGKLNIPDNADISYTPYFEYTDTDWHSPRNDIYSLANGLNGGVYRTLTPEQGGTVKYLGPFCHTLSTFFCSSEKYFDDHPEYFALHKGKRQPDQLCLTNDEVYKIVLDEVLELLKNEHDENADLEIVSLTQHDNMRYCTCDKCKALDEANGSQSGTMITFVNKIAAAVKEAGYNNVAIDTFAYQYTRKAPTAVKPEKNVIVRLCTIECCFSHTLDDSTCEQNVALMQDLTAWNKICNHIYVWDYTTNYAHTNGIFPDFGTIQRNMQIFCENGVKGVYEEGNYYIDNCDTEFGELRAYLLSRLMQNPYCDFEKEKAGFLSAFYGGGAEQIGEILRLVTENGEKQHNEIYYPMSRAFSFTEDDAKTIDALWEKAKDNAAGDEFALANIKRSEISWRFVKSSLKLGEFSGLFDRASANKALLRDIIDSGAKTMREGGDEIKLQPLYQLFPADKWNDKKAIAKPFYSVSGVLYGAALLVALVIFVFAIKKKRYMYCVHLPLFAALIEVAMWSRRAFLAWKDIGEYFLTLFIFAASIAFASYSFAKLKYEKKSKIAAVTVGYTLIFIGLYELTLLILHTIILKGTAPDFVMMIDYAIAALFVLILFIGILKALKAAGKKKSKKRAKSDEETAKKEK